MTVKHVAFVALVGAASVVLAALLGGCAAGLNAWIDAADSPFARGVGVVLMGSSIAGCLASLVLPAAALARFHEDIAEWLES